MVRDYGSNFSIHSVCKSTSSFSSLSASDHRMTGIYGWWTLIINPYNAVLPETPTTAIVIAALRIGQQSDNNMLSSDIMVVPLQDREGADKLCIATDGLDSVIVYLQRIQYHCMVSKNHSVLLSSF